MTGRWPKGGAAPPRAKYSRPLRRKLSTCRFYYFMLPTCPLCPPPPPLPNLFARLLIRLYGYGAAKLATTSSTGSHSPSTRPHIINVGCRLAESFGELKRRVTESIIRNNKLFKNNYLIIPLKSSTILLSPATIPYSYLAH